MSPELIDPQRFGFKNNRPTKASDCYALGMVVYETISGNLPFHKYADITVAMKVLEGEHPPRGTRFTTGLWKTLEQCWASQPNNRPSVEGVRRCLETFSKLSEPPSPEVDAQVEDSGDDLDSENSSPGALNETTGTTLSERSTDSMSYLTDHPLGGGLNSPAREETDPDPPIPQIDSNDGDAYQVTTT